MKISRMIFVIAEMWIHENWKHHRGISLRDVTVLLLSHKYFEKQKIKTLLASPRSSLLQQCETVNSEIQPEASVSKAQARIKNFISSKRIRWLKCSFEEITKSTFNSQARLECNEAKNWFSVQVGEIWCMCVHNHESWDKVYKIICQPSKITSSDKVNESQRVSMYMMVVGVFEITYKINNVIEKFAWS